MGRRRQCSMKAAIQQPASVKDELWEKCWRNKRWASGGHMRRWFNNQTAGKRLGGAMSMYKSQCLHFWRVRPSMTFEGPLLQRLLMKFIDYKTALATQITWAALTGQMLCSVFPAGDTCSVGSFANEKVRQLVVLDNANECSHSNAWWGTNSNHWHFHEGRGTWPIDISEQTMPMLSCNYMWQRLHSKETSRKQESKLYGAFNNGLNSLQGYDLNNLFFLIVRRRWINWLELWVWHGDTNILLMTTCNEDDYYVNRVAGCTMTCPFAQNWKD
jgi:hypothetical protein